MPTREQNRIATRGLIIDTAISLLTQQSLAHLSLRKLAQTCGVSHQTLYNHFPSKAHLAAELLARNMPPIATDVDALIKQYDGNLIAVLQQISELRWQHIDAQPSDWLRALLTHHPDLAQTDMAQPISSPLAVLDLNAHDRTFALLRLAQGRGELPQGLDTGLVAHTLTSLAEHALNQYLQGTAGTNVLRQTTQAQTHLMLTPYIVTEPAR